MKKKLEPILKNTLYWNVLLGSIIVLSLVLIGWRMTSFGATIDKAPDTFEGKTQNKEAGIDANDDDEVEHLDYSNGVVEMRTHWYKEPKTKDGYWYNIPMSQVQSEGLVPAYCLQSGAKNIGGHKMTKDKQLDQGYVAIIENGWPNKSITGANDKDYYITQIALWMYIYDNNLESDYLLTEEQYKHFKNGTDEVSKAVRNLLKLANNKEKPTISISISAQYNDKTLYLTSDGKYYESRYIEVTHSDPLTSYSVVDIEGLNGAVLIDENEKEKTTFKKGERFKVRVPASSITETSKTISLKVNGTFTTYVTFSYYPDTEGVQTAMPAILYEKNQTKKSALLQLTAETVSMGFVKQDKDTKENVVGAVLEVRRVSDGSVIDSWTTDGTIHTIDSLILGEYILVEKEAPDGYVRNKEGVKFTIGTTATPRQVQVIVIENQKTKLEVSKVDEKTNALVPGAKLVIKDREGNIYKEIITTTEPTLIEGISIGKYTIEETEAPEGYVLNKTPISFEITNDGKVQRVVMKQNYTNIKVIGQSVTVETTLVGFTFQIKDQDGQEVTNGKWTTTSSKLSHTIKNLPLGKYTLHEIEAPEGYVVNEETIEFTVTGKDIEVVVPNDFTKVKISKQDITTKEELEGATLQIKNSEGEVIEEWKSTEEAHYIEKLPVGKYTLVETIVPEGYQQTTSTVAFEVKETGEIQTVIFYNEPIIEVPDTKANIPTVVYVLSSLVVLSGLGLIYVNVNNKNKKGRR